MRSLTESLASAFNLRPQRRKYVSLCHVKVEPSSSKNPVDAMRSDFEAVGQDIRYAMQQHGEATR